MNDELVTDRGRLRECIKNFREDIGGVGEVFEVREGCGHDVVVLLDSITRLARAYNTVSPASGKVLSCVASLVLCCCARWPVPLSATRLPN